MRVNQEAFRTGDSIMKFRTLLSGVVATLALSGAVATAGPVSLPGVVPVQPRSEIVQVQGTQALEEQVRSLNGRVEELNFQILQLQEQIRKMQEDNEFRFQELEGGKKSDAGGEAPQKQGRNDTAPQSKEQTAATETLPLENNQAVSPTVTAEAPANPASGQIAATATEQGTGQPERDFGTIVFDQNGNVVGGSVGDVATVSRDPNAVLQQPGGDAADNTIVAALPKTDDPEELYRTSYDAILSGKYKAAEAGFRQHAERFPADTRAADTQFWLGESLLGQQRYRDAAEVFLGASKQYPKARKAPETLFKLGVSLAGINQREVACATFAAVGQRYPDASEKLKSRVSQEQAKVRC